MQTKVVNVKFEECDVYIGRDSDKKIHMVTNNIQCGEKGWLGNPHGIGWCVQCELNHNREESISRFEIDFLDKLTNDTKLKNV